VVDHKTFVLCSDGDLMEGISHEAIALAGHLRLNKLIFLFDDNGISIDGPLTLSDSVDQVARFKAAGWNAGHVNGQDPEAVAAAIDAALTSDRPTLIACKTTIGFGAPKKAGTSKAHGEPLGEEEIAGARKNLDWEYPPFEIPARGGCPGQAAPRCLVAPFLVIAEARRVRAAPRACASRRARRSHRGAEGQAGRREADDRDPQGQRTGPRSHHRGDAGVDPRLR